MSINREKVRKILFITLSNIGDCILTLPVLDVLKREFPRCLIDVMVGPRPKDLFQDNPFIKRLIVYDKQISIKDKIDLIKELRREKYDLIVDLRNSAFPLFINARYKTNPFLCVPKNILHMRDRHLFRLKKITELKAKTKDQKPQTTDFQSLWINQEDKIYIDNLLTKNKITANDKLIIIAPGARSHIKCWGDEGFSQLIDKLINAYNVKIVLVGDDEDKKIAAKIASLSKSNLISLAGKITLKQLAVLLAKSMLLISNDSAVMHLGSYLNVPVVGIFGPTNSKKYGPWSDESIVVRKELACSPCQKAQCKFNTLQCMKDIKVEEVFNAASEFLGIKGDVV